MFHFTVEKIINGNKEIVTDEKEALTCLYVFSGITKSFMELFPRNSVVARYDAVSDTAIILNLELLKEDKREVVKKVYSLTRNIKDKGSEVEIIFEARKQDDNTNYIVTVEGDKEYIDSYLYPYNPKFTHELNKDLIEKRDKVVYFNGSPISFTRDVDAIYLLRD